MFLHQRIQKRIIYPSKGSNIFNKKSQIFPNTVEFFSNIHEYLFKVSWLNASTSLNNNLDKLIKVITKFFSIFHCIIRHKNSGHFIRFRISSSLLHIIIQIHRHYKVLWLKLSNSIQIHKRIFCNLRINPFNRTS